MPLSPFTTLQDVHISSYMPDFEAKVHKVDPDFTSEKSKAGKLMTYKQAKAEEILESFLFKNKLLEDVNMGEWRKLFEDITGHQLFEEAHKKNINKEATRHCKCSPSDHHVGHYQAVLREKWEGLDESEQENYNNQARENASNIYL
ncbi:hypothetical protein L208DRAFT_1380925 [Tricholoma matsutake]|nr:hypothetical protein L208DRAFT_1380925 [Tricholoma matsutake 945]